MKQNVGMMDRMLRICAGMVLLVLGSLFMQGAAGTVLLILGIPLLASGVAGFCPSYILLGISTKREGRCCWAPENPVNPKGETDHG
ncbi:MAG: DUF2892 domain-containing protein [Nitrospirae bacterium]|nr:DUF2892 domain-containing protein [Nitrospirota bacterium]